MTVSKTQMTNDDREIDTEFGKATVVDKPSIDLSENAMNTYEIMVESFWDNMVHDKPPSEDNKLLARLTLEKENNVDACRIKWGYDINPNKSITLEELQSIEFVGNLHTVLDSEYCMSVDLKNIIFAIFETIRKHYGKPCILEHIGATPENPDMNVYI